MYDLGILIHLHTELFPLLIMQWDASTVESVGLGKKLNPGFMYMFNSGLYKFLSNRTLIIPVDNRE